MRALVLVLLAFVASCFSGFNVTPYRAPGADTRSIDKIAVAPLVVVAASETKSTMSFVPGWMSQTSVTLPMSAAEYMPAQDLTVNKVREALAGRTLVAPAEVDAAMKDAHVSGEKEIAAEIAKRTGSKGTLFVRVRDFNQRAAAMENAQATGTVDVTLYGADGAVVWSLAAQVVRGPAGSTAAPSLSQFMEYAMEKMAPEIAKMMAA